MYEVDFLKVGAEGKSGDAIAMRFSYGSGWAVVIIDGGSTDVGQELVEHVRTWYGTSHVDLVISTHPDADHINGLTPVLEQLTVGELFIHQPWSRRSDVSDWGTECAQELVELARSRGISVTEPFTGVSRFGSMLTIVGPSVSYYESLLDEACLGSIRAAAASRGVAGAVAVAVRKLAGKVVEHLPIESLTDLGETTERNNSSVITLLSVDSDRLLLTGDAGIPALTAAADYLGSLPSANEPIALFQAPHHGSRRNLGPTILDRLLGKPSAVRRGEGVVSASEKAPKHPSPKVTNALLRRGYPAYTTERGTICFPSRMPIRSGWGPALPLPPLDESGEEDD